MPLKRGVLGGVPYGSIVRVEGRWGVVCYKPPGRYSDKRTRIVDFWHEGRELLSDTTKVVVQTKAAA